MPRSHQCRPGRQGRRSARALLLFLGTGIAATVGDARAQEPDRPERAHGATQGDQGDQGAARRPAAAPAAFVRGQLVSRYWLRWTGAESDQDLYETLSLDLGDEGRDAVTGHFFGRLAADLDGAATGASRFFSADDSLDGRVDERIYDAYADLHRLPGLALVRAGRQLLHETPEPAYFDGLRVETQATTASELQFGGYGGASTHLFEASPRGDLTAGLYVTARPWTGGRVRLDWMHLEDEVLLGPHNDDLLGAGVWQTIDRLQLEGQYSRVEGRDRDVRARVAYVDTDSEFTAQVTGYQLLRTQKDMVLELDPFFSALHEQFPYWQVGALAGKGLLQHVDLQLGADLRRVADPADVGAFNRDYERWFVTCGVHDLLAAGLTVSSTADLWHSNGQDVRTWGADIEQKIGDGTTVSAGSYYALYEFDLFLDRERDHVRTWYARLKHKPSKAWSFAASYEIEEADFDEFHVLRMEVTWHF